jgi:hypothetical protein
MRSKAAYLGFTGEVGGEKGPPAPCVGKQRPVAVESGVLRDLGCGG